MKAKLVTLTLSFMLFAQIGSAEPGACPDHGADPTKFCPVGSVWDERSKTCAVMA
ncbi:hypothetical protein N9X46_06095 [Paracoccaceae bacterium]|nr:hypothetical protein [Paracoccaceae bacterium]MDB3921907.1 hypothetical protein [Paracoccaceae bacterium]MDC0583500.1 hypothetical protein [Paracoccaceae bacterium]MED7679469.1 hypothetical protein [Rhodobacteraceae bacterium IMCC15231]